LAEYHKTLHLGLCITVHLLGKEGKILRAYDGCCGTGGMLTVLKHNMSDFNKNVRLYGQEINAQSYAICCAEMLMLGEEPKNIYEGDTLTDDHFRGEKFELLITNPPFGYEWKTEKTAVELELKQPHNRFVAGTPRISDGQLLFLQNLISKMSDDARLAIILNGSPLFSGDAGSGESEIRRYIIENGMLEAIVALPDQMFYNTGISTYIWILSRKHSPKRAGKIQLINAIDFYGDQKPKSMGNKRKFIYPEHREKIIELYNNAETNAFSKLYDPSDFGYTKVTIERPLYSENGEKVVKKGQLQIDTSKRDTENIPLKTDIDKYVETEVLPYVPDAITDKSKNKIGYEIPFTRYFYKYVAPRSSEEIKAKILESELSIEGVMKKVFES